MTNTNQKQTPKSVITESSIILSLIRGLGKKNPVILNLIQDPGTKATFFLLLLCIIHLTIWTLAPTLFQKNGALDVIEAIAWGGQWQLGYDRDPFLVAWIAHIVSLLSGSTLWSIYLFSQLCVITTFWAVWRLARDLKLSSTHALMAVLFLEGVFYYHFTTPEFNDNVLQLPLWALTTLFFHRALTTQKVSAWLQAGFSLSVAMLAKYFTVMLCVPMASLMLFTSQGRTSFKQPGVYFAAILSVFLFLPSLYWQQINNWQYIHYALHRAKVAPSMLNHIRYPVKFFLAQLLVLSPALVLFLLSTRSRFTRKKSLDFDSLYLLVMTLGPLCTVLIYSALTGTQMRSMWGTPLFSFVGLLLIYFSRPQDKYLPKMLFNFATFFVLSLVSYLMLVIASPYFLGYAKNEFYPSQQIAQRLTTMWHQQHNKNIPYVAGPRRLAARVNVYSPDHPRPYFEWDMQLSPWINEQDLRHKGALFVWDAQKWSDQIPELIAQRFPHAQTYPAQTFNWQTGAKVDSKVRVGVAILPPSG